MSKGKNTNPQNKNGIAVNVMDIVLSYALSKYQKTRNKNICFFNKGL